MNKARRKEISNIIEEMEILKERLEAIRDDEQEYFDNIPENLQMSDRAMDSEGAIDIMNDAIDSIDEAMNGLEDLT